MLYWFFVKDFGPIAHRRLSPAVSGLNNVSREGDVIIATNHLAMIDGVLILITCPRMVRSISKAKYLEGKGLKGKFKKWWLTFVGMFLADRSGGSKSLGALEHAREIIRDGHLLGIHIKGTCSPDGRLYKEHTGAAQLVLEAGCPIVPIAIIGSDKLQPISTSISEKGKAKVLYGKPIEVVKGLADEIIYDSLRSLIDHISTVIQKMSGQEFVNEYAQKVEAELKAQQAVKGTEK